MKLGEFSLWVVIGIVTAVVGGGILMLVNRSTVAEAMIWTPAIPLWALLSAAAVCILAGAIAASHRIKHPLLVEETPYKLYGFKFFLKPAFFREFRTTQLSTTSPEHITGLVAGPFCANCSRDCEQQIEQSKCESCGHNFQMQLRAKVAYNRLIGNRLELLKVLKIEVFQEAQSDALTGKLRPKRSRS